MRRSTQKEIDLVDRHYGVELKIGSSGLTVGSSNQCPTYDRLLNTIGLAQFRLDIIKFLATSYDKDNRKKAAYFVVIEKDGNTVTLMG